MGLSLNFSNFVQKSIFLYMAIKNLRTLTISLIFSGSLNIALLAAFAFYNFKEAPIVRSIAVYSDRKIEVTNAEIFQKMSELSFRELVSYLTNKDLVEEGFTKRDLALAALVSFHYFNLEKAISATPSQVRTVQLDQDRFMTLFPSLNDDHFEAIIRYAYQEKWPLTAKGLFTFLQKKGSDRDESLEQAFFVTTEFHALQTFFQKTAAPQEASTLLSLIKEGSWEILDRFTKEQGQMLDFSIDKKRSLLLGYLSYGSPTAAELLLKTDFSFALKRLEDRGILDLLSLLTKPADETSRFCVELLRSPRSDAVWQKAAKTLYVISGKSVEGAIDPKAVLAQFEGLPIQPQETVEAIEIPPPAVCYHVVKEGESLWKISRQYKVKVDDIIKVNDLEKDALYPGMTLKIP
jgi:hypothetical protein